jgi:hypothetical protein
MKNNWKRRKDLTARGAMAPETNSLVCNYPGCTFKTPMVSRAGKARRLAEAHAKIAHPGWLEEKEQVDRT